MIVPELFILLIGAVMRNPEAPQENTESCWQKY